MPLALCDFRCPMKSVSASLPRQRPPSGSKHRLSWSPISDSCSPSRRSTQSDGRWSRSSAPRRQSRTLDLSVGQTKFRSYLVRKRLRRDDVKWERPRIPDTRAQRPSKAAPTSRRSSRRAVRSARPAPQFAHGCRSGDQVAKLPISRAWLLIAPRLLVGHRLAR